MELLVIAKSLGYRVEEVPVNWYDTPGMRLRPVRSALQTLADLIGIGWNLSRGRYAGDRHFDAAPAAYEERVSP